MTTTEQQLIDICMELGNIAESNGHFLSGLARRIEATGQPLMELTLGELMAICQEHRERFNRVYAH